MNLTAKFPSFCGSKGSILSNKILRGNVLKSSIEAFFLKVKEEIFLLVSETGQQ